MTAVLNRWDDSASEACVDELALRAYSSRLLGSDPALVLLGGGNTSVKLEDAGGELLYVKGTGVDLALATPADFTPLRLAPVRALLDRDRLDYGSMMRELAQHVTASNAPKPSIETLLHAALPARHVEHTHADSILAITNTEGGMELAEMLFGDAALVVPYRHSGFALAKICAEAWAARATPSTIGIVLMHHGAVACGSSARESYENMLRLAGIAETYLDEHGATAPPRSAPPAIDAAAARIIATLRRDISLTAGYPLLLTRCDDPVLTAFTRNPMLPELAQQSPATPQHAVFARRLPMLGRSVAAFARDYAAYLRLLPGGSQRLDAAPRIVLDDELGALAAGITPWHMNATAQSYRHTVETMLRANAHGKYLGLPPAAMLEAELEYGGFEHRLAGERPAKFALAGSVSLITASVTVLAKEVVNTLLAQSGVVAALGTPAAHFFDEPGFFAAGGDKEMDTNAVLYPVIRRFGGIDNIVCTQADQEILTEVLPWLRLSPCGARVIVVDSVGSGANAAKAFDDFPRGIDIAVSRINVADHSGPVEFAQAVAAAIALPAAQSFPRLD